MAPHYISGCRLYVWQKQTRNFTRRAPAGSELTTGEREHCDIAPGDTGWWEFRADQRRAITTSKEESGHVLPLSKLLQEANRVSQCDGERPGCHNCAKSNRSCAGYQRKHAFILSKDMVTGETKSSRDLPRLIDKADSGTVLVSR